MFYSLTIFKKQEPKEFSYYKTKLYLCTWIWDRRCILQIKISIEKAKNKAFIALVAAY